MRVEAAELAGAAVRKPGGGPVAAEFGRVEVDGAMWTSQSQEKWALQVDIWTRSWMKEKLA